MTDEEQALTHKERMLESENGQLTSPVGQVSSVGVPRGRGRTEPDAACLPARPPAPVSASQPFDSFAGRGHETLSERVYATRRVAVSRRRNSLFCANVGATQRI